MSIGGELVLPPDVQIVPVSQLPPEVRSRIDAGEQDFTITRQRARLPSSVLDGDSAELLEGFRAPTRIVDAVLSYAARRGQDPEAMLEHAFPVLRQLYRVQLLVPAGSEQARRIEGELQPGDQIGAFRLIRRIQVFDDNEVLLGCDAAGRYVAVKFYRCATAELAEALEREAKLLARVPDARAPQVHGVYREGSGVALVTEWVFGTDAMTAADLLRGRREPRSEQNLLRLCARIAAAFADVHESGLLHGDVHPRNVLIESTGSVRLIDFGLAREVAQACAKDPRGGVPFYFDPEFAHALRRQTAVAPSCAAEQYSVAALLYQLWTGVYYLDWSLERGEMLRQIAEDEPVSFLARRVPAWPELEAIVRRALSKRADQRFADLRSLAQCLDRLQPQAQARDAQAAAGRRERAGEAELLERVLARHRLGGVALREGLPEAPVASVQYGAAGVAYALLRIAQQRSDPRLLAAADLWSHKSYGWATRPDAFYNAGLQIEPKTVGERSLFHSAAGLHCVRALVSAAQRDAATVNQALHAFVEHSRGPNEDLNGTSRIDAALGSASLLLGCAELIEVIPQRSAFECAPVRARGEELARDLLDFLESGPVEASEHLKALGIAHGWAGLVFALLRWARASGREPALAVRTRLDELARLAEPYGCGMRWPVEHGGSFYLDGWCNGSAGFAMVYALAYRVLGEPQFGELAERAAVSAWNNEPEFGTLCCGQAGIGYAMLTLHRITHSRQWLQRARACARRASADRSRYFLRDALYKGAVGAALLAEELEQPDTAAMPLFEPRV